MLHRMTTLLSTGIVFLAAAVSTAAFPTPARAADGCLVKPTGNPPNESAWYYQINRVTHQKCWVLGAKKTIVRNTASQGSADLRSSNELAEQTTAVSCIKAPDGQRPQGKRWYYRTDKATGQRCWQLGALVSKLGSALPAPSQKPVQSVAPKTAVVVLPQAAADAQARLETTYWPEIETAASPGSDIAEVANETLVKPTFESRWTNPSDSVRSNDRQSILVGDAEIHRPAPAALEDVTNATKASDRLFEAERPLDARTPASLQMLLFGTLGAIAVSSLTGSAIYLIYLMAWMRRLRQRYARFNPSEWPTEEPTNHMGISPELEPMTVSSDRGLDPNRDAGRQSLDRERSGLGDNTHEIEQLLARFADQDPVTVHGGFNEL